MRIVEFFGISGSGKTTQKLILQNLLKKKEYQTYSYKEIISKFLPYYEKNLFKFTLLKFYFFFKKNKPKEKNNYFQKNVSKNKNLTFQLNLKKKIFKIYEQNIDKIYDKLKNKIFVKIAINLIKNSHFNEKNKLIFIRWLKEELVANYLISKNSDKLKYVIDSEGFIQRLFIYSYKKKNKDKIIKMYLKHCPIPSLLIVMKKKVFIKKKSINKEFNMEINQLYDIYDKVLKALLKNKKIKIILIDEKEKFDLKI